jgi:hypothetical protein
MRETCKGECAIPLPLRAFTLSEKALVFRKATNPRRASRSAEWARSNAIAVARFSLALVLVTDRTGEA